MIHHRTPHRDHPLLSPVRWLACWLAAALLLLHQPAQAQDATDKAAAEALFQQGQELLEAGKFDEACPKFQASQELDPGVGTLLFLGDCYEKAGKLASAWAAFEEAASLAQTRGDQRAEVAGIRAAALRPRLAMLSFEVDPKNDVSGFDLKRNGVSLPKGSWETPVPLDAGSYEIEATRPGYQAFRTKLQVRDDQGSPYVVKIPALAPTAPSVASATPAPTEESITVLPLDAERGNSQETLGLVVAGAGAAALVVSGVLTLVASGKNRNSEDECDPDDVSRCSPEGVELREDARDMATVATVFGIGGGVVLATGAVLYLTAPSDEHGMPTGLTLGMRGRF